MHPVLAPMIERNAYIGGCDGVSVVKGAELIGEKPVGTMPHALILLMGDTLEAVKAFDEVIDQSIPRVALIDTFNDEKFEAIRMAEAMGERLFAIRLDTPRSRRGDLSKLIEEIRWELNLRGFKKIKIFVSGGLDEEEIATLNPVVDAYGIGTAISNAPVIDFSMDIIEIEGKPLAKRGKMSGSKQVFRCSHCQVDELVSSDEKKGNCAFCEGEYKPLLRSIFRDGKPISECQSDGVIREHVLRQLLKSF